MSRSSLLDAGILPQSFLAHDLNGHLTVFHTQIRPREFCHGRPARAAALVFRFRQVEVEFAHELWT